MYRNKRAHRARLTFTIIHNKSTIAQNNLNNYTSHIAYTTEKLGTYRSRKGSVFSRNFTRHHLITHTNL